MFFNMYGMVFLRENEGGDSSLGVILFFVLNNFWLEKMILKGIMFVEEIYRIFYIFLILNYF